jgi:spermidine synthase
MEALDHSPERLSSVGVAGLGAGTLAYYAEPGQRWTYYEIDPAVEEIARSKFSFLGESRGEVRIITGDARLRLKEAADQSFDLLIIDAFSSDSIPVHLLTKEALSVYMSRLSENGLIVFHISNRHLDLTPVIAALVRDQGHFGKHWYDNLDRLELGMFASHWVVVGRSSARVDEAVRYGPWQPLPAADRRFLWTDSYSNLFSVLR